MDCTRKHRRKGFTLIELLVVMLIISILLTLGAGIMKGAGGRGTSTALSATEALFAEARALAVGKGTYTRVIVDVDDPDEESYLRRVAIMALRLDDDGNPMVNPTTKEPIDSEFELVSRGYLMPGGVFFSREYSKRDHEASIGDDLEEMTLTGVRAGYDGTWIYYQFNPEGICTNGLPPTPTGDYTAPTFVVGAGARSPGSEKPTTTRDGRRDFQGFAIWRNGSTSVFRDPDQILLSDSAPTEF